MQRHSDMRRRFFLERSSGGMLAVMMLIALVMSWLINAHAAEHFPFWMRTGYVLLTLAWILVLRQLRYTRWHIIASLVALWCGFLAVSQEEPATGTYDWHGHSYYIAHIVEHAALPLPQDGWSSAHPPLYYVLAATFHQLGFYRDQHEWLSLRVLSSAFAMAYLLAGMTAIRRFVRSVPAREICLIMLWFWPGTFRLHDSLGNDACAIALHAWAIVTLLGWRKDISFCARFSRAVWICAVMMLVKANALLPFAIALVFLMSEWVKKRIGWRELCTARTILPVLAMFIATVTVLGRVAYHMPEAISLITPNIAYDPMFEYVHNPNTLENMLWFDVVRFLREPYFDWLSNVPFWHAYFTQLAAIAYAEPESWPYFANGFILVWWVLLVAGSLRLGMREAGIGRLWCVIAVLIASQWYYRWLMQTTPSTHPRYTYPIIMTLLIVQGVLLERLPQGSPIRRSLMVAGSMFAAGCVMQFLASPAHGIGWL